MENITNVLAGTERCRQEKGDTWCKLSKSKENLQSWGPELNEARWEESEEIPDCMGNGIKVGETMYSQGNRILEVEKDKRRQGVDGLWRAITSREEPELISRETKKNWRALNRGMMWNSADAGKRQLHNLVSNVSYTLKTFSFEVNLDFQKRSTVVLSDDLHTSHWACRNANTKQQWGHWYLLACHYYRPYLDPRNVYSNVFFLFHNPIPDLFLHIIVMLSLPTYDDSSFFFSLSCF